MRMERSFMAAAGILLISSSASADVYSCQVETICICQITEGCSGRDQYLRDDQTEVCRKSKRSFEATAHRREVSLVGEGLKIHLREARPYLSDLDWYQAGATEDRGLINFNFDNESDRSDFRIQQMMHGSVNNHSWTMSGSCEVVD